MHRNRAHRALCFILAVCVTGSIVALCRDALCQKEDPYDLIIVCNKGIKDNVDLATVRDLFLRKRLTWPSGASAVPVNASPGSKLRREFLRRVLSVTEAEDRQYWEKAKIMNALTPPPEFSSALRAVFRLAGSLAYVFRAQYQEGVSRLLLVVPADEKSYEGVTP